MLLELVLFPVCLITSGNNLQEPERVVLGEHLNWMGAGAKRKSVMKKDEVMYIPLLKTLQSMLDHG